MNSLILAIILTLVPLIELRGGLPVALIYAKEAQISTLPIFFLILFLNILLIFIMFYFLDNLHGALMKNRLYSKLFNKYLEKTQKKVAKFEKTHATWGEIALFFFVAVPLPLTGAYSGAILAWLFNLNRKKSILAISTGVTAAGFIIYLTTLGIFSII